MQVPTTLGAIESQQGRLIIFEGPKFILNVRVFTLAILKIRIKIITFFNMIYIFHIT